MTLRIESSRKHGPFDPRYVAHRRPRGIPAPPNLRGDGEERMRRLKATERSNQARGAASRAAVLAWEGEGGTAR